MKKIFTLLVACTAMLSAQAQSDTVRTYRYAGPYAVSSPVPIDSVNINGRKFEERTLIDCSINLDMALEGETIQTDSLALAAEGTALHLAAFDIENNTRNKISVSVKGASNCHVYVDGERLSGERTFDPSRRHVVIKALTTNGKADTITVSVKGANVLPADKNGKRYVNLLDIMCGERCNGANLSPNGKYLIYNTYETALGGRTSHRVAVRDLATGRDIEVRSTGLNWLPRTNKFWWEQRNVQGKREIVVKDPVTLCEEVWASNLPEGSFRISPNEDFLLFTHTDEGPKKDKDVYEILEPNDRQGGFRNRTRISIYDLKTGIMRQLTYGKHRMHISDCSNDGKKLLLVTSERRLTQRPSTVNTVMIMDIESQKLDTLVANDGFVNGGIFSPDGTQVLLKGSPDALNGIGRNVREGQIPNTFDTQIYLMNLSDRQIRPLTKFFNPNVDRLVWSQHDDQVYFLAEDKDCKHLFRLNTATGNITQLPVEEDYISSFSIAKQAPIIAYYGQGLSNTSRLYTAELTINTKTQKLKNTKTLFDSNEAILKNIKLGEAHEWKFVTSRGDTLANGYVLPPYFDPTKKYPMVVYYYGGTSPTTRTFDSGYPFHLYAAMGYVVLYVNPSGATGFGQEWSARHVNTAGEGVAEEIIESAKQFCATHEWINDKKVGCIGASYGGFMTQVLQTKTDFFAAAISHAGISSYSSYWGEGYWGYSYSETERANSYPWNRRDLFVDRSPLFNADKIHTPLLFLHGTIDTNVPIGESIQMFTALKLLGRETALVAVEGQDHWIQDYGKRQKWQNTIFAWFAKWLQDDDSWWKELYGDKTNLE